MQNMVPSGPRLIYFGSSFCSWCFSSSVCGALRLDSRTSRVSLLVCLLSCASISETFAKCQSEHSRILQSWSFHLYQHRLSWWSYSPTLELSSSHSPSASGNSQVPSSSQLHHPRCPFSWRSFSSPPPHSLWYISLHQHLTIQTIKSPRSDTSAISHCWKMTPELACFASCKWYSADVQIALACCGGHSCFCCRRRLAWHCYLRRSSISTHSEDLAFWIYADSLVEWRWFAINYCKIPIEIPSSLIWNWHCITFNFQNPLVWYSTLTSYLSLVSWCFVIHIQLSYLVAHNLGSGVNSIWIHLITWIAGLWVFRRFAPLTCSLYSPAVSSGSLILTPARCWKFGRHGSSISWFWFSRPYQNPYLWFVEFIRFIQLSQSDWYFGFLYSISVVSASFSSFSYLLSYLNPRTWALKAQTSSSSRTATSSSKFLQELMINGQSHRLGVELHHQDACTSNQAFSQLDLNLIIMIENSIY